LQRFSEMNNAGYIMSVAFSPDGSLLAADSDDGSIRILRISDGKLLKNLSNVGGIRSIAFSPQGNWLAAGSDNNITYIWRLSDWQEYSYNDHKGAVNVVAFSSDGKLLASGSDDGTTIIRNMPDWDVIKVISINYSVQSIAFSPTNEYLAITRSNYVHIYSLPDFSLLTSNLSDGTPILSLDFSPDGILLAGGASDNDIRFWQVSDWGNIYTITCGFSSRSVKFAPKGNLLAVAGNSDSICLVDSSNGNVLKYLTGHNGTVISLAFSLEGWWLTSSSNNEVFLWGVPRWNTIGTPTLEPTKTRTPTATLTPLNTPTFMLTPATTITGTAIPQP
jgi:WD40 repeat protein